MIQDVKVTHPLREDRGLSIHKPVGPKTDTDREILSPSSN